MFTSLTLLLLTALGEFYEMTVGIAQEGAYLIAGLLGPEARNTTLSQNRAAHSATLQVIGTVFLLNCARNLHLIGSVKAILAANVADKRDYG